MCVGHASNPRVQGALQRSSMAPSLFPRKCLHSCGSGISASKRFIFTWGLIRAHNSLGSFPWRLAMSSVRRLACVKRDDSNKVQISATTGYVGATTGYVGATTWFDIVARGVRTIYEKA